MKITAIRTKKVLPQKASLENLLSASLPKIRERSIIAVTSKIIALLEGSFVQKRGTSKKELIFEEAEYLFQGVGTPHDIVLTIKNNLLIPTAGIDESNAHGTYVLWPRDPQKSANAIRTYLKKKYGVRYVGVIITDSRTTPLRRGTVGAAIVHSGFVSLNNYIGKPDIFGKPLLVTQANIMDALAASAVAVMGEGNEQTPLAVIEHIPFVTFQDRNPTPSELKYSKISLKDDLYAPLLQKTKWQKRP